MQNQDLLTMHIKTFQNQWPRKDQRQSTHHHIKISTHKVRVQLVKLNLLQSLTFAVVFVVAAVLLLASTYADGGIGSTHLSGVNLNE